MDDASLLGLREELRKRRDRIATTIRNLESQERAQEENAIWLDNYAWPLRETSFAELDLWYRKEINELDQALERMADPKYGVCLGCSRKIERPRLQQSPETVYCSACETMWEQVKRV